MTEESQWPGPADIDYQSLAQAGGFGQTLRSFVKFLDLHPRASVLDAGTGPGLLPRLLAHPDRLTVGSDASHPMLRHAQSLAPPEVRLVTADVLLLPFATGSFDAATASNLLFLLPDPAKGAAELARLVRPGGCVGWLNPSDQLCRTSAAAFADERGLTGFARFAMVNYGRIAEESIRWSAGEWVGLARWAGLEDVVMETRAAGLIVLVKGRRANE